MASTVRRVTAPATTEGRAAELAQLRELLLLMLVVTIPLAIGTVVWFSPGGEADFNRRVSISPFDIALALLIAVAVAERRPLRRWASWSALTRVAVALGVVLGVAFLAHPSVRGIEFAFRVAGVLAVVDGFCRVNRTARQRVLGTLLAVGVVESVIGMAQSAHGGSLGIGPLEYRGFFYTFGSSTAGHAGFDHPYHLAYFLLVALSAALLGLRATTRPMPWIAGAALCSAGLATTYSRAALLSLLVFVVLLLFSRGGDARKRSARLLAAAVAIGFVFGAVAFGNGWHTKGENSTSSSAVDSDRRVRAQEALRLIDSQPILGVGPGRYTIALESVEHSQLLPAHNVVLHEAAEGGVLAGALTALLLVLLAVHAWRDGFDATAVFALPVLFFVLDAYPYVFPTGLAASGIWLGMVFSARRHVRDD
jgi:hypothetical protein